MSRPDRDGHIHGKAGDDRRYPIRRGPLPLRFNVTMVEMQLEEGEYGLLAASEDRMWWFHGARALMIWAFRDAAPPPGPILDAGCGTGGLLHMLETVAPERLRIGLDQATAALSHAAARETASLTRGSVNRLPFADASLAAILSADVLCHRDVDLEAAIAECARSLMSGGVLILNLPAYDWMKSTHDRKVHTIRRFVRRDLAALLTRSGLHLRRATYWNAVLLLPMICWRLIGPASSSDVRPYPWIIDRTFRLLLGIERGLIRRGLNIGFGSSILAVAVKP
ncbi:MAG: class I SAM-dependent methyltransferase [Pseudomonadota bacterium]